MLLGVFATSWFLFASCRAESPGHTRSPRRPVIFLGLDAADWSLLDDYIARGVMPNLAAARAPKAPAAVLKTHLAAALAARLDDDDDRAPARSSIASSTFVAFNPATRQKEPITSDERAVPAIWNMATAGGQEVGRLRPLGDLSGGDDQRPDRLRPAVHVPLQGVGAAGRASSFPPIAKRGRATALARAEQDGRTSTPLQRLSSVADPTPSIDKVADSDDPYAQPVSALRRMLIETTVYGDLSLQWIREQHPDLPSSTSRAPTRSATCSRRIAPPRQAGVVDRRTTRATAACPKNSSARSTSASGSIGMPRQPSAAC